MIVKKYLVENLEEGERLAKQELGSKALLLTSKLQEGSGKIEVLVGVVEEDEGLDVHVENSSSSFSTEEEKQEALLENFVKVSQELIQQFELEE